VADPAAVRQTLNMSGSEQTGRPKRFDFSFFLASLSIWTFCLRLEGRSEMLLICRGPVGLSSVPDPWNP
jgi:hypothetical protein